MAYASILGTNGLASKYPTLLGQKWTNDTGATFAQGMDYACRVGSNGFRFELRNTPNDRSDADPVTKRRSELHDKAHLCDTGKVYWGAFSFLDALPSDPAHLRAFPAGSLFQMHMPGGGSPVWALRRKGDGTLTATVNPGGNKTVLKLPVLQVPYDVPHDLVYRMLISPTAGQLDIYLGGKQVLAYRGPLSDSKPGNGYYPCYGLYFGSGMAGTLVAEYANIAEPSLNDLSARTLKTPAWPAGD